MVVLWLLPLVPLAATPLVWAMPARSEAVLRNRLAGAAALALTGTAAIAIWAAAAQPAAGYALTPAAGLRVEVVGVARAVAVLVPLVALPVTVYAAAHEKARGLRRLVAALIAFVAAMELLVVAADLLTLLVAWELVGALSWLLIGHQWRDRERPQAAAHAFLATRAGDLGLFLAVMAAFAGTGSFRYADLAGAPAATLAVVAGGVLLAAASKSAQVPFAPWLFSAMAGPTAVSALLHAATMVAAGAYALARLHPLLEPVGWFGPVTIAVGLVTAIAAGVVAGLQGHAKRLLAASTSAQYGLMFVAIGAGFPGIAVLHLVAHAMFKALLFLSAGTAMEAVGSGDLARMRLGSHLRATAIASAIGALALAAVPPLGAAWTKEEVVAAAATAGPFVAALTVVAGGLSAFYAARFQLLAFGRDRSRGGPAPRSLAHRPGRTEQVALVLLAAATVALSALWLPPAASAAERLIGAEAPAGGAAELTASLLAVAAGVYVAVALARRRRLAAIAVAAGPAADWLGLPTLSRRAVADPVLALCRGLARLDAGWDRTTGAVAAAVADGGVRLGRGDDRIVDGAVRAVTAAGVGLARVSSRLVERGVDGVVAAIGAGVGAGGRGARRLQTGMAHHYLTIVTVGTILAVVVTAAWR